MGNYKKYAERHLRTCELLLENGEWNISAQNGVSYIEKILKDKLEDNHLLTDELMRSCNIKKLFKELSDDKNLYKVIAEVSGYYFDTVYPGSNSIELDKHDCERVLSICYEVKHFLNQ